MKIEELRKEFPILSRKVNGRDLVYFDNAATSQRPRSVIEEWNRLTSYSNANIHRAVHTMAEECTEAYEQARDAVRAYINAASREEIIFTSGATASINLVAYTFGERFVSEGDEIIVAECEHHSDMVPWYMLCRRKNAKLVKLPVDDNGRLDTEILKSMIGERTRLVAVAHVSNVLGIVNPVEEIVRIAHSKNVPVLVDGAQGIVHCEVDVRKLDCDFYAFSGHKMYAATGTGVLYGKRRWLEQLPPFMGGGEMIASVSFKDVKFADIPMRYEAGTQNFASSATLKQACDLLNLLKDRELNQNFEQVCLSMQNCLKKFDGLKIYGNAEVGSNRAPLWSFTVEGVHHEDLAILLDKMGVAVRSGQMCAEPLMERFGVSGMLRVSLAPYN
ncbi:MAG: SufS family cysteine desulfurase, partial [Candidatus Cryptobacteroides sp.]|nr:SufS family cysteine desulfurase [Candidatus Cryptobacteroides sp.]